MVESRWWVSDIKIFILLKKGWLSYVKVFFRREQYHNYRRTSLYNPFKLEKHSLWLLKILTLNLFFILESEIPNYQMKYIQSDRYLLLFFFSENKSSLDI